MLTRANFVDNETLQYKNTHKMLVHYALMHIILQLIYRQHLHVSAFVNYAHDHRVLYLQRGEASTGVVHFHIHHLSP